MIFISEIVMFIESGSEYSENKPITAAQRQREREEKRKKKKDRAMEKMKKVKEKKSILIFSYFF